MMGQCGCGETRIENAVELANGIVVAYDVYQGCADCHSGPGVAVYIYPDRTSEFLQHAKIKPYQPDEYGGNQGVGISIGLFTVDELRKEAEEMCEAESIFEAYGSLADWLGDNGLRLVQGAMRRFAKRLEDQQRKVRG